jgi:dihydroorotate dehydrogenase electron transfer subunit
MSGQHHWTTADRAGVAHYPARLRRTRRVGAETDRREGDYLQMTFELPVEAGFAAVARPGQFVALSVGDATSAQLLRRAFSIHAVTAGGDQGPGQVDPFTGQSAAQYDSVDLVVAAAGAGTRWLTGRSAGLEVDLVGPLGRPFPLPTQPVTCVLVGGGYGSAPLFWLADVLRSRGCHVEMVLGAATRHRLYGVDLAQVRSDAVVVTTDDGTLGIRGRVSDVLAEVLTGCQAGAVYACGPMPMLEAVSAIAAEHGAVAQVAVEESMACGIGVCMTCVLPVEDKGGTTRMVRSCVEGPVFRGDRVRWDAFEQGWCTVPEDTWGAS